MRVGHDDRRSVPLKRRIDDFARMDKRTVDRAAEPFHIFDQSVT